MRKKRAGEESERNSISLSSFFYVSPVGGRSPDGRRYPGDWEIKIEPAERKLREEDRKPVYSEFYCVAEEEATRRQNDAGEIFDLNVGGDPTALARSNFCY